MFGKGPPSRVLTDVAIMDLQLVHSPSNQTWTFPPSATIIVGRTKDCDVVLPYDSVSSRHALIFCIQNIWFVFDLRSSNGTRLDNKRIERGLLQDGKTVFFADQPVVVRETALPTAVEPDRVALAEDVGQQKRIGPFILERMLHNGSRGELFLAQWTEHDNKPVAIKLYGHGFASDEAAMYRFCQGVSTAGPLRHPHLLKLFRAGRAKDRWFLAMEYAAGGSARDWIRRHSAYHCSELLPPRVRCQTAARVGWQIAEALAFAAQHQVLHTRITPAAILFDRNERAKLGDFVLARDGNQQSVVHVTQGNVLIGDLPYLSPEQALGRTAPDIRTDLYSLAAVMYEIATGIPPFVGDNLLDLTKRVARETPHTIREVDPDLDIGLEQLIARAMSKNPDERLRNAEDFRLMIERTGLLATGSRDATSV